MQMQMQMQMQQGFGMGPAESHRSCRVRRSRPPATRFACRSSARARSFDSRSSTWRPGVSRYLGQAQLQPQDVASVKLFVTNRNGAEAINVLWRDLTVRADRISGLGTIVRTVLGDVVYADPTSIEKQRPGAGRPAQGSSAAGRRNQARPKAAAPGREQMQPKAAPAARDRRPPPPRLPRRPRRCGRRRRQGRAPAGNVQVVMAPAMVAVHRTSRFPASPFGPAGRAGGSARRPSPARRTGGQPPAPPKPKAKIPLDELESIHFERTPSDVGPVLGQPNVDFTMPGLSAKKEEPPKKDETAKKDEAAKKGEIAKNEPR